MVAFSPDEKRAITANNDSSATIWNMVSLKEENTHRIGDLFGALFVGFAPSGEKVLIGRFVDPAIWLDVSNGSVLHTIDTGRIEALSPDGTRIISSKGIQDAMSGEVICSFRNYLFRDGKV